MNASSVNSSLSGLAGMFTFSSVKHIRFQTVGEANQERMLIWFYADDALQNGFRVDFNLTLKQIALGKIENSDVKTIGYVELTPFE